MLSSIAVLSLQLEDEEQAFNYFLKAFRSKKRFGKIWDANYIFVIREVLRLSNKLGQKLHNFEYFLMISFAPDLKPESYNFSNSNEWGKFALDRESTLLDHD